MTELRQRYPLAELLKVADLARSTFYYQQKLLQAEDKCATLKDRISALFSEHKGRYGYRRITAAIRRGGEKINHKKVRRLMGELCLKSCIRPKKYKSFKGNIGKIAPNLLKR